MTDEQPTVEQVTETLDRLAEEYHGRQFALLEDRMRRMRSGEEPLPWIGQMDEVSRRLSPKQRARLLEVARQMAAEGE